IEGERAGETPRVAGVADSVEAVVLDEAIARRRPGDADELLVAEAPGVEALDALAIARVAVVAVVVPLAREHRFDRLLLEEPLAVDHAAAEEHQHDAPQVRGGGAEASLRREEGAVHARRVPGTRARNRRLHRVVVHLRNPRALRIPHHLLVLVFLALAI